MNFQRYLITGLLLILAYQAADLSWALIEPLPAVVVSSGGVRIPPPTAAADAQVDTIFHANLLGRKQTEAIQTSRPVISPKAVKTRHAIKLVGIVRNPLSSQSVAILVIKNQQAAYMPGDSLGLGNASQLLEVLPGRVVIEVDGRQEYVELEAGRGPSGRGDGIAGRAQAAAPLPLRVDLNNRRIKALVGDYRQKILSDPLSFGKFVQISPQVEGNRVIGYRLNAGRDGRLFETLGLRPGDVVTHINHLDLSKPENLSKLIALVSAGGSIPVGIRRGGELVDIDVEL